MVRIRSRAPRFPYTTLFRSRAVGLTMSGQSPIGGYVLTASDTSGNTTWSAPGGVSGWTISGSNIYETGTGNVEIGRTHARHQSHGPSNVPIRTDKKGYQRGP